MPDKQDLDTMSEKYLEWMKIRNYSTQTVDTRRANLRYFVEWAKARGITSPSEITKPIIERYQRYMYHYRKRNGDPLSFRSQHGRLVPIRAWFKWLAKNNYVLYNPAADIELPKLEHRLPKHVLTASEAEQVINRTNINDPIGIRDRAILETFYSTGIRRMEMIELKLYDLDIERGVLAIRQGKGKKDRVIPIGDRAIAWIDRYLIEVRPSLITEQTDVLFLNQGKPFSPHQMSQLVGQYVEDAEIGKHGSCHLFRHTMATLMLENGADIRYIQAMLGHVKLETTQIYTQVSIRKLKEIHTTTHPAKLERK